MGALHVDRQTLSDLDIATLEWRGRDLLTFLDRTRSIGGRARLRSLLCNPLETAEEIEERQKVLREISARIEHFDSRDLGHLLDGVQRYLASSYMELPRSRARCLYVAWRQPEMMERLLQGLEATARLLIIGQQMATILEPISAERTELDTIRRALRGCLEKNAFGMLMRVRTNRRRRLNLARLDHAIRRDGREALTGLVNAIHEIDALQSLACAAALDGFAYPTVVDSPEPFLVAEAAFHPLVASPCPADIDIGLAPRLIFLTGPNMAGKTTYLKTCGVIAVLAHVGMAVPARSATLSTFEILFSILTTQDSVSRGESYFLAEVRRVGALAEHLVAGKRVLALADEMFKGTNVLDAHDATELVVTSIARYGQGAFIVSSHLTELAERFAHSSFVALMQFDVTMNDGAPSFTFQLTPGVSAKRLGMFLLQREGVAQSLASIANSGTC